MAFTDGDWKKNPQYVSRMEYYAPKVNQAVQKYGLERPAADLIQGILGVESRWGLAKGLNTPGASGELGIAQLTPDYRKAYNISDPLDAQQSINGVAEYIRDARRRGVPWDLIPVGYNAGDGRLRQLMSGQRSFASLPQITRNYVDRIRQFMGRPTNPNLGLVNYSPAITRTLQQYGLSTAQPTTAQSGLDLDLSDLGDMSKMLGVGYELPKDTSPFVQADGSTDGMTSEVQRVARSDDDGQPPVPLAGLFGTRPATAAEIDRLLQGIT
ncbi:lytic transglycosylase domain-containing protein [Xenorhabdus sp. XENO-10]|uniref:Lytic transglycosylase domain-containing protein n=1 Tax=Xenorhabdus yunnanensis TaxID=3025878 RepID=A0ABT5LFN8_9GAMM|nr:lytic transglycosylase domain-containing protein [Xenorhabdus yunnanensis]MDC9589820.1 lytic transglycosylase domain-containing protein [Xenorhabdus yunnanensis]